MARCYVRSGVWGWSTEDQIVALRDAGVLGDDVYTDILSAARAKRPAQVKPEWLTERALMLKPTSRKDGETIAVATLLALGVGEVDLVHAIAQAFSRRAAILAVDSGLTIKPDDGAAGVNVAMDDWTRAKRDAQTKPGRRLGNASAAAAAKARTLAKLPVARLLWRLPTEEISTQEIAKRADLSVKTLYAYLGRRGVAQSARRKRKSA